MISSLVVHTPLQLIPTGLIDTRAVSFYTVVGPDDERLVAVPERGEGEVWAMG